MSINLGLDIGSVSLKLAAVGRPEDTALLADLVRQSPAFRDVSGEARGIGGPLVISEYRRILGSPIQAAFDLLKEFHEIVPESCVEGIRVTGSGSRLIARLLGIYFENEFKALARATASLYPEVRTVFEMGGENSKYLRLDPMEGAQRLGIADYSASGECAAGTGSFIDQQASRMEYAVEEVGGLACSGCSAARIAGRCSVFAKSDMIHAQQKGYTPPQILRGLCDAVARNFKSAIVKGRPVVPPVAFIGAVSQNAGVVAAIREAFKLDGDGLIVPPLHAWFGAIGAAQLEQQDRRKRSYNSIHHLQQHAPDKKLPGADPLSLGNVVLLRDRVKPYHLPAGGSIVDAYLGIDIGSVSTNLALIDESGDLMHEIYLRTVGKPIEVVSNGLKEIDSLFGNRVRILGVGTTGSGRELIGELVGADTVNDEITAHKTGAMYVSERLVGEMVDTIFEIGGQDSKFISIDNGVVVDFAMNEACAAGTGSFLEEQAEKLGINIKGEFADLALHAEHPTRLGERCTVFMERDVTGFMNRGGAEKPDIVAGLAYSIVFNYLNRVVRGRRIGEVIFFQGGTAYNDAVAAAFSQVLGKRIIVPPHNGVIGAIGMALIARERYHATGRPSHFRGYSLSRVRYSIREFVCKACSNYCDMKEVTVEGQKTYWGDQCSWKFRPPTRTDRRPVIPDLFEVREELLKPFFAPPDGSVRIGVPRTMFYFDRFPFWATYLRELGFSMVLSDESGKRISDNGLQLAVAEPCFPVQLAHGHVHDLLENKKADYVLLPNNVDEEAPAWQTVPAHLCPWNQTLPFVVRMAPGFEGQEEKFLAPTLHFQLGRQQVKKELRRTFERLGVRRAASDRAVEAAYAAQTDFRRKLEAAGREALAVIARTGEPAVVIVGRSYNVYDTRVNCDVPRKLRERYGVNVVPWDFLPLDEENISDMNPNMFWSSGRRILAAGRLVSRLPGTHIIFITNFKCGPDSFIKHFLRGAAASPFLTLMFDGHGNDAGYMTRCEAYLDSKGILRCYARAKSA
jgi:predicted CoA-substrate-specific enzyme activase